MSSPSATVILSSPEYPSANGEETATSRSIVGVAPSSSCYHDIRPTPYGGRGAFASRFIPESTVILKCEGPYASVVLKKFRKEVCAWCFAWVFESTKGKKGTWNIRLDSSAKENGGSSAWTPWFCGGDCRDAWIKAYSVEIDGLSDHGGALVGLMTSLDKTLLNYRNAKARAKAKQKATSSPSAVDSSSNLTHPFTFLDTWKAEDVSEESVDRYWISAETTFTPPSLGKRAMILDLLESWNDASSEDPTELLTEFEGDCARFVLDGLVRRALQQTNTGDLDHASDATPSHVGTHSTLPNESGAMENVKPTGRWSDLLQLQNNELEHVKSKPYMLGVFVRVYAFLRLVVLSTLAAANSTKKSRAQKRHGSAQDLVETSLPNQDAFLQTLAKLLETSESVRAVLARDHGNVFGIWEKGSPSDSNGHGGEDDSSDSEMLGWGMYVFGSYFNHDCTPTVRKMQHGRSLCFTATRDIEPGEELCINYIDISQTNGVVKRNEELSKEWFFECGCARCERERKELI